METLLLVIATIVSAAITVQFALWLWGKRGYSECDWKELLGLPVYRDIPKGAPGEDNYIVQFVIRKVLVFFLLLFVGASVLTIQLLVAAFHHFVA